MARPPRGGRGGAGTGVGAGVGGSEAAAGIDRGAAFGIARLFGRCPDCSDRAAARVGMAAGAGGAAGASGATTAAGAVVGAGAATGAGGGRTGAVAAAGDALE